MNSTKHIPIYSLDEFQPGKNRLYQVEVFDANRHFNVQYPHRHDFYEVLYLCNGSGYHLIDSNRYKIKPPCIFFLSPGQTHNLELSHDIEGYIFLFTAEFYLTNQRNKNRLLNFPFFFSVDQENPPLFLKKEEDNHFLKSLFTRGCMEVEKKSVYPDEIIRSLLDIILLTCDQLYPEELRPLKKGKGHILAKNFLLLIEENYQNNLSVEEYAKFLAVTPNHLTQMVKQIMGKTCHSILQEKQISEIKQFLIHSNMTVSEIAETMNFVDQSYFTKFFKKHTGITPLQFRKKSMINT
ncbi:MAG: AraC family transcriptional regulator [Bacteroidota bacterium]